MAIPGSADPLMMWRVINSTSGPIFGSGANGITLSKTSPDSAQRAHVRSTAGGAVVGVLLLPIRHLGGQKSNRFWRKLVVLLAETGMPPMGRGHDSGYAAGKGCDTLQMKPLWGSMQSFEELTSIGAKGLRIA